MRFEQTKECKDIDILPEQEKYISSIEKINNALQQEGNYGFNIYIDEYKMNPCRLSSIPYWKTQTFKTPNNISVIHDEEYNIPSSSLSVDTLYFRLKHNLKSVEILPLDKLFEYRSVDVTCISDLEEIVAIINKSYTDIQVDLNQVTGWTKLKVFDKDLWIFIIDTNTQKLVALGIAERDKDMREGMLEWIQVLPEYRGSKLGQAIVKLNLQREIILNTMSIAYFLQKVSV